MVGLNPKDGSKLGNKASTKSFNRSKSPPLIQDKNKKKAATGTPEKVQSPRSAPAQEVVINGEDIQRLAIKEEDLAKVRESFQKSKTDTTIELKRKVYTLKKAKPEEQPARQTRKVVIARPAPPNAPLKTLDYVGPTGPRYDASHQIVPYSLLGSVEDFVTEAIKRNEIRPESPAAAKLGEKNYELQVKQYARQKPDEKEIIPTAMNQENALLNWQRKMANRKKQLGYISTLLQKPRDQLLMNQDEKFRAIQEKRKLVDRAIPAVDYGKGYRVGSEFWKQHENFGDDLTGIQMTLTKTERGCPIEFEHIGKPSTVKQEVGMSAPDERPTVETRKTWESSHYLKRRTKQLQTVMNELDPYKPELSKIEVIGNKAEEASPRPGSDFETEVLFEADNIRPPIYDPLSKYPDVQSEPIFGPSLIFGEQQAAWTGSSDQRKGEIGVVERVLFESKINKRVISKLNLQNNGTTSIYYEWVKKPKIPSFDHLCPDHVQRFYFNTGEGVIMPGEKRNIPFVFKSPNPGIFNETWQLVTRPALLDGASLQVVLKGVATQNECSAIDRLKIEKELEKREAKVSVTKIIDDLVKGIRTPERSPSPIDAYLTEEELFLRKNPGRFYDHETVMELKNIYLQLFPEEDREGREWNLSLNELQICVEAVPEEDAREELLSGLNSVIRKLSFRHWTPTKDKMYFDCYQLLQEMMDQFVSCSMAIRNVMDLPEVVMVEMVQEPETQAPGGLAPPKPESKDDRKTPKGGKKGGKEAKDDGKGKKGGKKNEKERPKSKDGKGKQGKGTSPTKELQNERDVNAKTPSLVKTAAATDNMDPATRKKYTEKMNIQVRELLLVTIDRITLVLDETLSEQSQNLN